MIQDGFPTNEEMLKLMKLLNDDWNEDDWNIDQYFESLENYSGNNLQGLNEVQSSKIEIWKRAIQRARDVINEQDRVLTIRLEREAYDGNDTNDLKMSRELLNRMDSDLVIGQVRGIEFLKGKKLSDKGEKELKTANKLVANKINEEIHKLMKLLNDDWNEDDWNIDQYFESLENYSGDNLQGLNKVQLSKIEIWKRAIQRARDVIREQDRVLTIILEREAYDGNVTKDLKMSRELLNRMDSDLVIGQVRGIEFLKGKKLSDKGEKELKTANKLVANKINVERLKRKKDIELKEPNI